MPAVGAHSDTQSLHVETLTFHSSHPLYRVINHSGLPETHFARTKYGQTEAIT